MAVLNQLLNSNISGFSPDWGWLLKWHCLFVLTIGSHFTLKLMMSHHFSSIKPHGPHTSGPPIFCHGWDQGCLTTELVALKESTQALSYCYQCSWRHCWEMVCLGPCSAGSSIWTSFRGVMWFQWCLVSSGRHSKAQHNMEYMGREWADRKNSW